MFLNYLERLLTQKHLKTQTHLNTKEVARSYQRRKLFSFGILGLCLQISTPRVGAAEDEVDRVIDNRKAKPVLHQKHGALQRRASHSAIHVRSKFLSEIPRAKVVRRVPTSPNKDTNEIGFDSTIEIPAGSTKKRVGGSLAKKQIPVKQPQSKRPQQQSSPAATSLVRRCDTMALQGLAYKFGADNPSTGGLDCSGAVQYLLKQEGVRDVPRTAYTQYKWLQKLGVLNKVSRWSWSKERVADKLRPGDLLFWKGTYNTGNSPNISHVMIYLGRDASNGKHYMFGASSRRSKGLHGNAVDVYEFVYPRKHGKDNFAGFGSVPSLQR